MFQCLVYISCFSALDLYDGVKKRKLHIDLKDYLSMSTYLLGVELSFLVHLVERRSISQQDMLYMVLRILY